jgi:hypothetical protein
MRYLPGDLRASDQGLGWNAGYVDAGPAYHSRLDHGDTSACLGLIHRQCLAGFSATEDKDIEMFNGDHRPLPLKVGVIANRSNPLVDGSRLGEVNCVMARSSLSVTPL